VLWDSISHDLVELEMVAKIKWALLKMGCVTWLVVNGDVITSPLWTRWGEFLLLLIQMDSLWEWRPDYCGNSKGTF